MKFSEQILEEMNAELLKAPPIYVPSNFWKTLNKVHLRQISESGINNFKRSITARYFSWGILGILGHQLAPLKRMLRKLDFSPLLNSKLTNYASRGKHLSKFNFLTAALYRTYVAALFDMVVQRDAMHLFDRIQEPAVGNPFTVNYKNRALSQDLCNSVHEFYSISQDIKDKKEINVAELGAGYGRLAYVFLKALPGVSYCIIDIPPALYIAQEYLSEVFPNEKIFKFRPFNSFEDVRKEFESARIKFILPHQAELLPKKYFDVMVNVSTLHEMSREQIKNYIGQMDRLCKGKVYIKQWRKSLTEDNNFIKQEEYPIPKNWRTVYNHTHPIQKMFFEALFTVES
jgi:putative sugar O-methyltransferase